MPVKKIIMKNLLERSKVIGLPKLRAGYILKNQVHTGKLENVK